MLKKFYLLLLMLFTMSFTYQASAQNANVLWFKTTAYAYRTYNFGYDVWNDWSNWIESNMNMKIDLSNDKITIYSPEVQIYRVYEASDQYRDSEGGTQVKFSVVDQDGDYGHLRLRVERNGNSQVYVDFNNVSWVYNVVRIQ